MKRLLSVLGIVLSLVILSPMVAFADDPPGTKVDVVVISGGDVDLGVDITAGGNSTVTIDGVDIQSTLNNINSGLGAVGGNISYLYGELWKAQASLESLWKTYNEGLPITQKQIDDMKQVINLLSDATAMLIVKQNTTNLDISNRYITTLRSLADLQKKIDELNSELGTLEAGQARFTTEFSTFASDTKINYETLVNAVNDLNVKAKEQKIKTDGAMRVAVIASVVAAISLILGVYGVTRKAK